MRALIKNMATVITLLGYNQFMLADETVGKANTVIINADAKEQSLHYKLIPLMTLDFKIIQQVCGDWISSRGKLVYEEKKNSVLVYDTEETIAKIQDFINSADRQAVNIRIDIDRRGTAPDSSSKIKVKPGMPSKRSGTVVYRNGKRIEMSAIDQIEVSDRHGFTDTNVSQFIITLSGSPALLWSGETMLDPSWLRAQKNSAELVIVNGNSIVEVNGVDNDFKWVDVGVSLMVLPRQLESGLIEVEIYPEISSLSGKGKRKTVKVESLSSKLVVQPGCRIQVGGIIGSKRSSYNNIFGPNFFTSRECGEAMEMYLTATVLKPSTRGKSWIPR